MLRCTGCGSADTIEEIRAKHPKALSCCPERKMVDEDEVCSCGDPRKDHEDLEGRCKHNKPLDFTHGYQDCMKFRPVGQAI